MTYKVTATRWEDGWELDIPDHGITQSHSLRDAPEMVRDYIALDTGADPRTIDVEIVPDLGGLETEADRIRAEFQRVWGRQGELTLQSLELLRRLDEAWGLTGADIAEVMHISQQRVSQLRRKIASTPGVARRGRISSRKRTSRA